MCYFQYYRYYFQELWKIYFWNKTMSLHFSYLRKRANIINLVGDWLEYFWSPSPLYITMLTNGEWWRGSVPKWMHDMGRDRSILSTVKTIDGQQRECLMTCVVGSVESHLYTFIAVNCCKLQMSDSQKQCKSHHLKRLLKQLDHAPGCLLLQVCFTCLVLLVMPMLLSHFEELLLY